MQQSIVGKEMLVKGKWDEKWNDGSEYVANIVSLPPTELVACPHATLHGSWKWNVALWGNFPKLFSSSI